MDSDQIPVKELSIAGFMAVFFVIGFSTATVLNPGTNEPTDAETDTRPDTENIQENAVTQDQVISNTESYLQNGPLSYPFTYNLSTENIQKINVGNTEMYNLTVSYTVEANPFQGPTYTLPGNQTSARKTLNLYTTTDGTHVFPSEPIRITQPQ